MDPAGLTALAAALEVPFRARREQHRYLRHGRARQRAQGAGGANRKLDLTDHLLATRMRQHLSLPATVIGALLRADRTTISHATSLTASLLAAQPQPPAAQLEHPGFGGDSILPRCSGLGGPLSSTVPPHGGTTV